MPKIIANVKEQIIEESKKQIEKYGYENITIRSIAKECGIAVGTVYNYFQSKDMIIATFVLQDWLLCIDSISRQPKENRRHFLAFIHMSLVQFAKKHKLIFESKEATKAFNSSFHERHKQLRSQLADLINNITGDRFTAEFVAEALLCWTMAGKSFDQIYELLPENIK